MKNLVLAGGKASKELSVLIPPGRNKVLLKVLGKPIVYYSVTSLQRVNRSDTILVYRAGEEEVYREALAYSLEPITPVPQERGSTVHEAVLAACRKLEDTDYFFLLFGDLIIEPDALTLLISTHLSEEPDATVLAIPAVPKHIETYGLLVINEYGYVEKVLEHSPYPNRYPVYIVGGAYILPTWILDLLEKGFTLPQALDNMARKGKVKAIHWSGLWIDIGYPADLLEAVYQLLSKLKGVAISDKAEVEKTAVIEGPVVIEEKAYIDHYTVIKGPAYIGRESFIGAHSFIREYADIEEKVRIGAYNEIKYSSIQPYAEFHSRVIVMNSIVGERAVLESNITTLNIIMNEEKAIRLRTHLAEKLGKEIKKMGTVIGYNSKIPTNTIINPGEIIKPNTIYRT